MRVFNTDPLFFSPLIKYLLKQRRKLILRNSKGTSSLTEILYESGTFDEQTIMSRTSHRSNAARTFKRASSTLVKAGSDALQLPIGEPEYKI